VTSNREQIRVSATKRPSTPRPAMSPPASQMTKLDPSTSVMVASGTGALSSLNVHGSVVLGSAGAGVPGKATRACYHDVTPKPHRCVERPCDRGMPRLERNAHWERGEVRETYPPRSIASPRRRWSGGRAGRGVSSRCARRRGATARRAECASRRTGSWWSPARCPTLLMYYVLQIAEASTCQRSTRSITSSGSSAGTPADYGPPPAIIACARFAISSGGTSSMCVETLQR
jgi:hypothetical protein